MLVAVTGGIAAGKSTVLRWFEEWGAHSLSLDQIAHTLSAPQQALWQAIVAEFGQGYLLPNGELNRRKLGETVFADKALRRRLNRISHPLILQEMSRQIESIRQQEPEAIVVVEVPLLVECALYCDFGRVVVVEADERAQRARLRAKGWSEEEISRRFAAQFPARVKRIFADWVVSNREDLQRTRTQSWQVWQELLEEGAK
ncbi:MAG: dephospho-CoA kinase [Armatimonadota bacterium]|nr:dephospho-CoA kinase [bacterium]MCS7309916.1 dephospho-CoA kinase [Armatimonadota bacterium]MDW8103886.1 dephospho-CoA kinase [Armatimonadota bacterium]MDW8289117.1 dephospho-CoA kinase [Armatimonadota bacterium]